MTSDISKDTDTGASGGEQRDAGDGGPPASAAVRRAAFPVLLVGMLGLAGLLALVLITGHDISVASISGVITALIGALGVLTAKDAFRARLVFGGCLIVVEIIIGAALAVRFVAHDSAAVDIAWPPRNGPPVVPGRPFTVALKVPDHQRFLTLTVHFVDPQSGHGNAQCRGLLTLSTDSASQAVPDGGTVTVPIGAGADGRTSLTGVVSADADCQLYVTSADATFHN